ncbi:MAG: arylsulfatase [Cyclobacteriaceae bacterium]
MNKFILNSLLLLMAVSCSQVNTPPPNVVIVLTDDQGWGDLGFNGNTNISTPNIDKMAREGAVFERFYVSPVCSPTRAELLTGRHHVRGGVYSTGEGGERLDLDETTIADVFKQAGYATAAFGKWHNGMQYPYHPNARGFDEFYGFCSGHWGNYFSPVLEHNGELVKGDGFVIDDFTNKAIRFITENKDQPFFLYLPYNTPHSPMQVPEQWWKKYENKSLDLRYTDPTKEIDQFTKAALAMCENIDWNVGRLMDHLKGLELDDNTIVLYFSDNGPNSWRWNGGMKGKKGSTDEGGVRSPLVMKWKGNIQPGKKIPQITSVLDLLPTLTDLAGLQTELPRPLDGKSLKPLLLGKNPEWVERYIVHNWNNKISVRTQDYKLDSDNRLYNMQLDASQEQDIAEFEPEKTKRMMAIKEQWKLEVYSELPPVDERTFPIGHPDFKYSQVPARDGVAHGNITRSNRWPNCSFFTNWSSVDDYISWEVEVLERGAFEVGLYYTCTESDIGATVELKFGSDSLQTQIQDAHDPPLFGMENDRVERMESYVKDFKRLDMGTIHLEKGNGQMTLRAVDIPGSTAMDFRLLMLKRVDE